MQQMQQPYNQSNMMQQPMQQPYNQSNMMQQPYNQSTTSQPRHSPYPTNQTTSQMNQTVDRYGRPMNQTVDQYGRPMNQTVDQYGRPMYNQSQPLDQYSQTSRHAPTNQPPSYASHPMGKPRPQFQQQFQQPMQQPYQQPYQQQFQQPYQQQFHQPYQQQFQQPYQRTVDTEPETQPEADTDEFGDNPYEVKEKKVVVCDKVEEPKIAPKVYALAKAVVEPITIPIRGHKEVIVASNSDELRKMTVNFGEIHGKVIVQLGDLDGEPIAQATLGDDLRGVMKERKIVESIRAKSTPRMLSLKIMHLPGSKTVVKSVVLE